MVDEFFRMCAEVAASAGEEDKRSFLLGAVAIRGRDQTVVRSPNGATHSSATNKDFRVVPSAHAEIRTLKKAGKGSVLFVARILRRDGSYAMARPCGLCRVYLSSYETKLVYYTIDASHYGIWDPVKDTDRIIDL